LKSKKIITSLFGKKEGSFFVCSPITVAYKIVDENSFRLPQVGFTVSKSKFKLAVDRNRIKRLMRTAYRTNKQQFITELEAKNKSVALMFIYGKRKIVDYNEIEKAFQFLLQKKYF